MGELTPRTCRIDLFPVITRKSFSRDRFHPVPVDAREVGDLAELEHRARLRDSETVGESLGIALPGGASADADVLAASLMPSPGTLWPIEEVLSALATHNGWCPYIKDFCPSVEVCGGPQSV